MKGFAIPLLGVIFVALITNYVTVIAADEPIDNNIVSEDVDKLNIIPTKDPKYEIYLHVVVRNVHGELINVMNKNQCRDTTELLASNWGCSTEYFDHEITDYAFDTLLGKKEIITIDNIKYEKIQFSSTSNNPWLFDVHDSELTGRWTVEICGEPIKKYGYECANIFWSRTNVVYLEVDDVTISNWTILKKIN